jgi:hypothetical protein
MRILLAATCVLAAGVCCWACEEDQGDDSGGGSGGGSGGSSDCVSKCYNDYQGCLAVCDRYCAACSGNYSTCTKKCK